MVGLGSERKVYVIGVGMTQFMKPGSREGLDYPQMCGEAVTRALKDARLQYSDLEEAVVGYVYGDSTSGQRALYDLGVTGIPIINVNNNCATGSSALVVARRIIQSGAASCVLALGFEKMERGPLTSKFHDRTNPLDKHVGKMAELAGTSGAPVVAQLFGNAGIEHMEKYGTKPEHFAKIAYKNHKHSTRNPYAQCQEEYTLEEIMNSPEVFGPLTKLQCCPTSDGSAAAVLADEEFVLTHGLQDQAVLIVAMETCTDLPSTFTSQSHMSLVGYDMTRHAATKLFSKTGYKPSQVDVVELHDCFSTNELISYEALGLCPQGGAAEFIDSGENTYGGRHVINPSGGMLSKGHPLGATGLAQCAELSWQLRGVAGERQVPDATLALQHNMGLGGAVVVALYRLGFPEDQAKSLISADNLTARRDSTVKIANPLQRIPRLLLSSKEKAFEKIKNILGMKEDVVVQEGIPEINNTANEENHKQKVKNKRNDSFFPSDDDEVQSFLKKKTSCEAPFQNKIKQNNGALTPSESMKLSSDAECHLKSKL